MKIHAFNMKLVSYLNRDNNIPLGLGYGKMGLCIYFNFLARHKYNLLYQETADKLIDEIINNVNCIKSVDIVSGLGGIGLGMHYLIKHRYLSGNTNYIFSDIDSVLFRLLSNKHDNDLSNPSLLIQGLYYFCYRLKEVQYSNENKKIFQGIVIQLANVLEKKIDQTIISENTLCYNCLNYQLPQILFVYNFIHLLNFYNYRIDKILEFIINSTCGIIPQLNCNKLWLLWALTEVNQHLSNERCTKYIKILKNDIDLNYILNNELKDKNIFFHNGLTSIYLVFHFLNNYYSSYEIINFKNRIRSRIVNSTIWNEASCINDNSFDHNHIGLLNGLCGTILTLYNI